MELRQAQVSATVAGETTVQAVTLPYHWDRYHRGEQGWAVFDIPFDLPAEPQALWGLFLPRLGNAYEIWLNGTLLQRQGDLTSFNGDDFSQVPRFVTISPGLLRRINHVQIRVRADVGRRGGLSPLFLGPHEAAYAAYKRLNHWVVTGALAVAAFSLLVGLLALALWVTQVDVSDAGAPRRDTLYLYAGLAEVSWSFGVGYALIEAPGLPWPWWGVFPVVAGAAWMCSMMLFCVHVAGWTSEVARRWFPRWLGLLFLAGMGAVLGALGLGQPILLTLWYAWMGVTALCLMVLFMRQAFRQSNLALRAVALALLFNVLAGLRDLYVLRVQFAYGEVTWLRYSSVLFGIALAYIVIIRFRAATAHAHELMHTLTSRIADRERELGSSYRRLELLAREQERLSERTRILRDMHDGVGSHISAAMRQLQSGRASNADVLQTLRDSMDYLKLTIDVMHLPPGDITALLANMRYRLEPRFRASDVTLEWGVDGLEPVQRLDAQAMRQLQFLMFEALSNVLQHAQASCLRIEASLHDGIVRLGIIDNGRGFDTSVTPRKGLLAMQERVLALGARLQVESMPGRTAVSIFIPAG